MVDNKPIDKDTAQHLKDVNEKYEERADVPKGKTKTEKEYEARSKAYSEGQEEVEAKRKEDAKPYEKLSKLVDEHSDAARKTAADADEKK
jgi:predicted nuclease with TOPRIM domain